MSANKDKYLIIIAGPTAVGKTKASIRLAQKYNADIFSCDSRQIYKEMNIGTAKPNANELAAAKHHFINYKSVTEHFTAGDYERDIDKALSHYFKANDIAILTGGTGLYIKATLEGLDVFPEVPDEILKNLESRHQSEGLKSLVSDLQNLDKKTFETIDLNNSRRVIRALSVCLVSGSSYSSFLRKKKKELSFKPLFFVLEKDRKQLYEKINQRVDKMMDDGLLKEVESLLPYQEEKSLQTVGYSELFSYLRGDITLSQAVDFIKRNSRRYAKRQMTWFRNQEKDVKYIRL